MYTTLNQKSFLTVDDCDIYKNHVKYIYLKILDLRLNFNEIDLKLLDLLKLTVILVSCNQICFNFSTTTF